MRVLPGGRVAQPLEHRERRGDRRRWPSTVEVVAADRTPDHVLDERLRAAGELAQSVAAVSADEVRRVQAPGEDQDDRPGPGRSRGTRTRARRRARRPRLSRTPAPSVVRTARPAGAALAERGAARRDRVGHAGACHRDDIGVALDQEDLAASRDGALRPVEVVEDLVAVDGRLGRVHVLRALVAATGQHARADPDGPPRQVVHRERDPAPEAVADVPPLSRIMSPASTRISDDKTFDRRRRRKSGYPGA